MTPSLLRRCTIASPNSFRRTQGFRSKAALEALEKASDEKTPTIALYNYPSFSGAFSALFAHLFHSHLRLPCLILPFSSVEPLSSTEFNCAIKQSWSNILLARVDDLCIEGLKECYFLDFLGPRGFAAELSHQSSCKVIGFDHRKSVLSMVSCDSGSSGNVSFRVDLDKSSSTAAYEYFSTKLLLTESSDGEVKYLLNPKQRDRLELVLKYIEDADLRQWSLPNIKAFNLALGEWRSMLNCMTNPHIYEQLLEISSLDLIGKGNSLMSIRQDAAKNLLDKGVRADGYSNLTDEIAKDLSLKSAAAGLRPIGAVIYMQRKNLKMCLRSTDAGTDTSEVAKLFLYCLSEREGIWWRRLPKFQLFHNKDGRV
ncbi:hypothetical protein RHSIM_Rhsim05G0097300 [Rhododendron simsii]|uniref:Uncharacterized protein n=1 Tax=Rhododendron simsii TaxID=118357 RepID=A0A834LPT7_RHOSS|nr:hypothetical protein RHSIM_Rhsim05G0097300 [Rhododendron simsii]